MTGGALADRVVLVTGSSRGIGAEIVVKAAEAGATVALHYNQSAAAAQATLGRVRAIGGEAESFGADIGDGPQAEALVARVIERFGRVDALVNNAQTFRPMASIADVGEDDLDVFYTSGVKGTLWAMQAVYPHMKAQHWGRIVNFASSMGITGGRGFAAYNASKEAIRAITRTAAREWATDGIVVNAIAPAAADHHGEAAKQSEGYRIFVENCPMGRQGDPELDIGPIAWFLCSDACRYLTGHTFMADGGAFMWA